MDQQLKDAMARVDVFIKENPNYTGEGLEQPEQGVNNRVIFARKDDRMVVFKVFSNTEFKARECYSLRHWRKTAWCRSSLGKSCGSRKVP